ncbi:predicted protein [Nematostella vectensis]|uniref:Integrator complex subunit 10 n=1 Tax=Nematostella vectensis TaxID=45351 RepID=A7SCI1_NEMVE|nr:predicted protein [Nematostella vectensis]|eukprot:XP_001630643.1 predicted protein [Nematostella vectensis]
MAKTSTERSQIRRSKLRKDYAKYNEYKHKDKERKRAERDRPKEQSQQEIDRKKKANRDRVRKFRLLQKGKNKAKARTTPKSNNEKAYKTPQALVKAVGKVKHHLPKSPQLPRNVCLCQYHENIKLICDCLSKQITEFPSYTGDFVDNFVCSPNSEECMHGKCSQCPKFLDELEYDDTTVTWYEWERTTVSVPAKEGKDGSTTTMKKMQKVCKEGTVSDVLASLDRKLPFFLQHVFIKRIQSEYILKASLTMLAQMRQSSSFQCIEPDEDGFVKCRLYCSQSAEQATVDVFPFPVSDDSEDSDNIEDDDFADLPSEENNLDEPVTKNQASTSKGTCCSDDLIFVEETATSKSCTSSTSKGTTQQCDVHMGLPHGLDTSTFVPVIPYFLPQYVMNEVEAVVGDLIQFNGDQLIGPADINALVNNSAPRSQDMWLTNFIIDAYFKLIKSSQENKRVIPISWEKSGVSSATPKLKLHSNQAAMTMTVGYIHAYMLYARCLADIGHMVEAASLPQFRNGILLELQRGALQQIPYPPIEREKHYAVHYQFNSTCKYYIGRVLSMEGERVRVKYLHRVGANRFDWPMRDDIDDVHVSCIFFGPVALSNAGPFMVPMLADIEKKLREHFFFLIISNKFPHQSVKAGITSVKQLLVARKLGNPLLESQCQVFLAMSLVQRGFLKKARHIIRQQYRCAVSNGIRDTKVIASCQAVWNRIRYVQQQKNRARKRRLQTLRPLLVSGSDEGKTADLDDDDDNDSGISSHGTAGSGASPDLSKTELAIKLASASPRCPARLRVRVLWNFEPVENSELKVVKGEMVVVLYREDDWVLVVNSNGRRGFIPFSYCSLPLRKAEYGAECTTITNNQFISAGSDVLCDQIYTKKNTMTRCSSETQMHATKLSSLPGFTGLKQRSQSDEGILGNDSSSSSEEESFRIRFLSDFSRIENIKSVRSTPKNSPGVSINGRIPYLTTTTVLDLPEKDVSFLQASPSDFPEVTSWNRSGSESDDPTPTLFQKLPHFKAMVLYDFEACAEDDVSVTKGDVVNVLNRDDDDWWWVTTPRGGEGFVPCSYLSKHLIAMKEETPCSVESASSTSETSSTQAVRFQDPLCTFHSYVKEDWETDSQESLGDMDHRDTDSASILESKYSTWC